MLYELPMNSVVELDDAPKPRTRKVKVDLTPTDPDEMVKLLEPIKPIGIL